MEIGGSNHPYDFVFNKLKAKKWICIDLIMNYQIENNPEHYKNTTICNIDDANLVEKIKNNKYIIIRGDVNKYIDYLTNKIDVVYSVCSFEHISNLNITIDNVWKYLKDKGIFYSYFGPIYSGFNGSHFWSDNEKYRFNAQPNELDFLHILYSKEELPDVLRKTLENKVSQKDLDTIISYFLNNDKFVNELFFDDYDNIMKNSKFTKHYKIKPVFEKQVAENLLIKLKEKYPNNTHFGYSSIAISAVKK